MIVADAVASTLQEEDIEVTFRIYKSQNELVAGISDWNICYFFITEQF